MVSQEGGLDCEIPKSQEKATQCRLKPRFRSVGKNIKVFSKTVFIGFLNKDLIITFSVTGIQVDFPVGHTIATTKDVSTQCDSFGPFTSTPECSPVKDSANLDQDYVPPHPCFNESEDEEDQEPEEEAIK